MKPKKIVSDLNLIRKRIKPLHKKVKERLKKIYERAKVFKDPFTQPKLLTLRSLINLVFKAKIVKLGENPTSTMKYFWLWIECIKDPEESLFKIIRKKEKREKYDERIEDRINKYIQTKTQEEILFEDFEFLLGLIIIKYVKLL